MIESEEVKVRKRRSSQEIRRLVTEFEASGLRDREFDSIKITPDIPEEYAYALDHQGPRPRLSYLAGLTRRMRPAELSVAR